MMTAQPTRSHLDLPDGFDVVGLSTLLDPDAMKERLNISLPRESARIASCRIVNLRQKTRTSCTVCYELTREMDAGVTREFAYARAFSREEFGDASRRAEQSRWALTTDNLSVTHVQDLCVIIYWFPNDERLDGLRRIVIPKKLQRLFYEHFSEYASETWRISDRSIRLQVLRYKPERRAVLRCRFRAQRKDDSERHERFVYLGLYETDRLADLTLVSSRIRQLSYSATLWAPANLIGVDKEDALMIWDELPGTTLRTALMGSEWPAELTKCAKAVAQMHSADGSLLPPRDSIKAQTADVSSFLARVLPERVELIVDIAQRLERRIVATPAHRTAVVHGDLHPGQIILGQERVGLIDFDRSHAGDPLEDVGNLRAQLWLGPPDGIRYNPTLVCEAFLDAYAESNDVSPRELDAWTGFSLFRSATVPLGRFQSDWRVRTSSILEEADRLLS